MQEIIDDLLHMLGTHTAAAEALGYTDRQYRNIRRRVERGEGLHPRVETFILVKSQMLHAGAAHAGGSRQP